jgi:lincosamide nucleotidyltransferase A/C/D/E
VARGVQLWVDGGWGIDALLERQTHSHKDFDAIVAFEDLPALTRFLSGHRVSKVQNNLLSCDSIPS